MQALRSKCGPLQDTKPVLLVDDHEPELLELHAALHERVCADDELNRPRLDLRELPLTGAPARRARLQRHAKPGFPQQP